ncbi:MAG: glycosyltransferase family 4 protein [Candidatus Krumholzibacteria bacterium]|nr:glycosyltransferase family 4 protein [Candidatus Krumholzibacteria bacterium]
MARILVIASFTRSLTLFRGDLLREMVAGGHEVTACSPEADADTLAELAQMGVRHLRYDLQRTGLNPLADLATYRGLRAIIRAEQPDQVLAYTIKPVIYGCLAAAKEDVAGVRAMITGLGTAFEKKGLVGAVLGGVARFLYRRALAHADTVFFQNPDDCETFLDLNLVQSSQVVMINGSGVNTERFAVQPLPAGPPVFLLIARLLQEKGVREFAAATRILRDQGHRCSCRIVGFFDSHPQAIAEAEMKQWVVEGLIEFLGEMKDVRPALADCTVFCLPSYREGLPRTVLEAMATGRAIITTDAPGCRETVVEGENGFLVPVRDPVGLARAMTAYLDEPSLAVRHGARSREMALESFAVEKVNHTILGTMGLTNKAR